MDSEKLASKIGRQNVGKIAERIVANELEACGFLVRDLNLEGISANADLLAITTDGHVLQIQVKGSTYDEAYSTNGWWFQYGHCSEDHISSSEARMFNRKSSPLKANYVAMVCVRSPYEYQYLLMPIDVAEQGAQINLDYGYRPKKKNGEAHKPGKVWIAFYPKQSRTEIIRDGFKHEQELLRPYLIDRSRIDDTSQRNQSSSVFSEVLGRVFSSEKEQYATLSA